MSGSADRLVSLDVFRGMTIAGMVLVNNPGTWSAIYGPLKHAEWHGITPTDYIFPFFLFIVGVAIPIAFSKRIAAGITRDTYLKIFARSAPIFAVGLLMSAIPFFIFAETTIPHALKILIVLGYSAALFLYLWDKVKIALLVAGVTAAVATGFWLAGFTVVPYNVGAMRIPGVLQRIAVCYLFVALIYLHTTWKQQAMISAALLLGYWFLMTLVPVPGCEVWTIDDKACNLAAWLDRTILTENHIWRAGKVFDPEGILSTIPALVTTLSGVLAGSWLKSEPTASAVGKEAALDPASANLDSQTRAYAGGSAAKAAGLFFAGTIALAVGWSWSLLFPLNKSLWTSSYVVYTSGLALLALGACYWLIDVKGYKRWALPFVVFGVNALALFVFSGIMARLLGMVRVAGPETGKDITLQQWVFSNLFLSWATPINASLAYAICFILFWLFLMWLLYRKRIYIKV
jgi:predicted acyltransferase